jgi:hypothetical protein
MQSHAVPQRILGWAVLLACVAALSGGCGKSAGGARLGGESHFLGNCTQGCGELSCIAGICTLPCAEASACGDLNAQAVCRIEAGEATGFCDVACSGAAACPGAGELSCQVGYCRSESSPDAGVTPVLGAGVGQEASSPAQGEPRTCVGDFIIPQQAELDALEGCEEITGSLQINYLDVTSARTFDLRALHALKRVGKGFGLSGTFASLAGLEQLESVGRLRFDDFRVRSTPDLPQLRTVALLDVWGTNFTDLSMLRHATGITKLNVLNNTALVTLAGLSSSQLREVTLDDNPALNDLNALSGVASLDVLELGGLPIQNLDELSGIRSIGRLTVGSNSHLENLDGLANVASLGDLEVRACSNLSHLAPFSQLTELGHLTLVSNGRLELGGSFSALRRLTALTTIDSDGIGGRAEFPQLESATGIQISQNTGLSELRLPVLRDCDYLTVQGSPQLAELQLPAFKRGTVDIERNEQLSSVELPLQASQPGDLYMLVIALNPELEPSAIHLGQAASWKVERVGGNAGAALAGSELETQQLDPCPWEGDGICDACGYSGVGISQFTQADAIGQNCPFSLCANGTDTADCAPPADAGP